MFRLVLKDVLLFFYYFKKIFGDILVRGMICGFGWVDNFLVEVEVIRVEFGVREVELVFIEE